MKAATIAEAITLLCLLSWRCTVEGLPGGAPAAACSTLTPDTTAHLAAPQLGIVPYEVDLSALDDGSGGFSYEPGVTYTLTFESPVSLAFRGVLLQGRFLDDSPAGTFTASDPNTRLSSCTPANSAVTHNSAIDKTSITTEWTAPPAGSGAVQIGFGVVNQRPVYWGNQRSSLISERATVATDAPTTDPVTTAVPTTTTSSPGLGLGGDPHFSIKLPSDKQLCYSVQGEAGFIFNLISNKEMSMNALFVADTVRKEVTWIGGLGMVIKNAPYKNSHMTTIGFDATKKTITVGNDMTLKAENIGSLTFRNGKVVVSHAKRKFNCTCFPIQVDLQDIGLNFSVHFVKNNRLDMKWENVQNQPQNSHGIIGQFFRSGVDIDEIRHFLVLPGMEPVPVMRKPIWHFMERDTPDRKMCWVAMNPGYQGKKLIQGSYLDYVVDDLFTTKFKMM